MPPSRTFFLDGDKNPDGLEAHRHAMRRHVALRFADAVLAEVEDTRREYGISFAVDDHIDHMLRVATAAAGDHRHLDRLADRTGEQDVVAVLVAIGVHAGN